MGSGPDSDKTLYAGVTLSNSCAFSWNKLLASIHNFFSITSSILPKRVFPKSQKFFVSMLKIHSPDNGLQKRWPKIYCLALPKLSGFSFGKEQKVADIKPIGNFRKSNGIDQRRSEAPSSLLPFFGIFLYTDTR